MSLVELLDRFPAGWSEWTYDGRRYGVTKSLRAGGRAVSLYAEELGGTDVVSTNAYLTSSSEELRPCEMPAAKVRAFLRDAMPAAYPTVRTPEPPETTGDVMRGGRPRDHPA